MTGAPPDALRAASQGRRAVLARVTTRWCSPPPASRPRCCSAEPERWISHSPDELAGEDVDWVVDALTAALERLVGQ
jgi:hypothetical protein